MVEYCNHASLPTDLPKHFFYRPDHANRYRSAAYPLGIIPVVPNSLCYGLDCFLQIRSRELKRHGRVNNRGCIPRFRAYRLRKMAPSEPAIHRIRGRLPVGNVVILDANELFSLIRSGGRAAGGKKSRQNGKNES